MASTQFDHKQLYVVGTSFRLAPAEARKCLVVPSEAITEFYQQALRELPGCEFWMLSTCNRIEFYLFASPTHNACRTLDGLIALECPAFPELDATGKVYRHHGRSAHRHLLRVICGLDSQVLGDTQIVQQLRQCFGTARSAGSIGSHGTRALSRALSLGAKVRSHTQISAGAAGVPSAVSENIVARWNEHSTAYRNILLVGAGKINAEVARHLAKVSATSLSIVNRSTAGAKAIADRFGANCIAWEHLVEAIGTHDVVVCATASAQPVITDAMLRQCPYFGNRKLVIDAGMPPNVAAQSSDQVEILGIDAIHERQASLENRQAAVADVESMVEAELSQWDAWLARRPIELWLKSLYLDLEQFPDQMLEQLVKSNLVNSHDAKYQIRRKLKQFLHPHVHRLRRGAPLRN